MYFRASMRLAYQDLSVQTKKQDEKMKSMDPKKREQMERLGMGFGGNRYILNLGPYRR